MLQKLHTGTGCYFNTVRQSVHAFSLAIFITVYFIQYGKHDKVVQLTLFAIDGVAPGRV